MRGYALAMGIVLTVGYGCVAQMAVRSAAVRQAVGPGAGVGVGAGVGSGSAPAAAPDTVWCGGTLPPVVVEAPAAAAAGVGVAVVTRLGRVSWSLPCETPLRRADRAT